MRLVAFISGMSVAQTIALDITSMTGIGLIICWVYLPAAWPLPLLGIILGVIAGHYPQLALPIGHIFLPGSGILLTLAWRRAIRQRGATSAPSS